MKAMLAASIFALLLAFPGASSAGLAPDADGDGIPDVLDNCDRFANAGALFCDADADGYGNACDADLDNNFLIGVKDLAQWRIENAAGASGDLKADLDCSGAINLKDLARWRVINATPSLFSSGLSCAGTIPCN